MIHTFLIWSSVSAIVLSAVLAKYILQGVNRRLWQAIACCVVLGPPMWAVLVLAVILSAIMLCVQSAKKFRAAKVAQP